MTETQLQGAWAKKGIYWLNCEAQDSFWHCPVPVIQILSHNQFQATNLTLVNVELWRKVHNWLLRTSSTSQLQHTSAYVLGMVLCAKATELHKTRSLSWYREWEGEKGLLTFITTFIKNLPDARHSIPFCLSLNSSTTIRLVFNFEQVT